MQLTDFLATTALFEGSSPQEIEGMLGCLGAFERTFDTGAYIHRMGDCITTVGLIVEGRVRIESVDIWGNVSVIGTSAAGQLFGEAYAAIPDEPLMVNVVAAQPTKVLFLSVSKVITTCSHACPNHSRTSANLTMALVRQTLALSRRIFHVAPKTMREKILTFLSDQAERVGSMEFDIPFNRQQLADYLGVDRSALSAELSRMQRDGLIETKRSHFKLRNVS